MLRTLSSVVLASALAVGLAVSAPGAASAKPHPDHASVKDKVGDRRAGIDLVAGSYFISKREARFTARVRDLTDRTFLAFEIWPLNEGWDRLAVYRERGRTVAKVYWIDNSLVDSPDPVPHPVKCPSLKVSWQPARNKVSVTWPVRCRVMSRPYSRPFEFHVFSRFGGVRNSPTDALPARTLDF